MEVLLTCSRSCIIRAFGNPCSGEVAFVAFHTLCDYTLAFVDNCLVPKILGMSTMKILFLEIYILKLEKLEDYSFLFSDIFIPMMHLVYMVRYKLFES